MKILMVHTFYQNTGGEDKSYAAESDLLRKKGQNLLTYTVHNDALSHMHGLRAAGTAVWNRKAHNELSALIRSETPDVVHIHNTFPLMSPAAFWAAKAQGCAVVATLHNYRLICPDANFVRDGRICEDCAGRVWPWPGVVHGCYRDSRVASAVVASTLFTHRILQTWSRKVDIFIALSEFARRKLSAGGIPAEKIVLKPNFVDPDPGPGGASEGYALFVGRLAPEKGIDTLLEAWDRPGDKITLRIVGAGPLSQRVELAASQSARIEFLGYQETPEVMALMAGADFLIMPSLCYETFGLAIIEAFARERPVIASRLGALAELVEDGRTGLHFEPGDPDDLAAKVAWAIDHPVDMQAMGQMGRRLYVENYGAHKNYERLMEIYHSALTLARRHDA